MLLYLAKTYDTGFNFHFQDEDLQTELCVFPLDTLSVSECT